MSKILDNTTGSNIAIGDTGVTVTPSTDYTIPATDYPLWAASDDIIVHIGTGDIVVNDGSSDLSINDGMKLIQGIFPNPVGIEGASGTQIGNIGDALKVTPGTNGGVVNPAPPYKLEWHSEPFLNGASPDMDVDGSTTPVVFEIAPPAGEIWYAVRLRFQIDDNGVIKMEEYGGLGAALTNGLKVDFVLDSTTTTFKVFKTNYQLMMHFTESFSTQNTGGGFVTGNFFQGGFDFTDAPITLNGDDGDKMKVTVQDDLSGLTLQRMALTYWHKHD